MRIVKQQLAPSRADAVRLNRTEKTSMLLLSYAAAIIEDLPDEIGDRIAMVENGPERIRKISAEINDLLQEIRVTIPMNQRQNLVNTVDDYEARFVPKATPYGANVLIQREEFRELVDAARIKCRECTEDDENCEKCKLYQLLTVVLPLDEYHGVMLCPYNLGEWKT